MTESSLSTSKLAAGDTSKTPPAPHEVVRWADLLAWFLKYVTLPLVPFALGSGIRLLERGAWIWDDLDPGQLSFSLAALCMLGIVSIRHHEDPSYRDAISAVFQLGAFIFVSMFAYSVALSAQLANLQRSAVSTMLDGVAKGGTLSEAQVISLAQKAACDALQQRLNTVLEVVAFLGLIYIAIAILFRFTYNLGDE